MGQDSAIEWTDHTFNPWWGCTKVSPGCTNCYAETLAKRYGWDVWGPGKERRYFDKRHWDEPLKWNAAAMKAGVRRRVFCASMGDVFDNEVEDRRGTLWDLIRDTPNLDWLLLTKRIGNAAKMVPESWRAGWPANVWAGASIVNQEEADRDIPKLLAVPARIRFLSCEPLLGPIDLYAAKALAMRGDCIPDEDCSIDWCIVGGESGPKARPMHPNWARSIRDQCQTAGVPFFFKQWGEWLPRSAPPWRYDPPGLTANQIMVGVSGRFGAFNLQEPSVKCERVGKKAAGRLLDGREWNEFPPTASNADG